MYRSEPARVVEETAGARLRLGAEAGAFVVSAFRRTHHVQTLTAGWMLAVTLQLDFVPGLFTVFTAEFPERAMRFDDAFTGGVRALRC
jgi:hypothetical protein